MVNVNKSKWVVFRRSGRLTNAEKFYYNGNPLEIRSEYNHFGRTLSSHGVFHKLYLKVK